MGTSRNAAELTRKITNAASETKSLSRQQLSHVADAMRSPMLATAAQAKLRPGSLIAKKPWRGVYIRSQGEALAVGYAKGANLIDQPTRGHFITPRGVGSAKNQHRYQRRTGQAKASLRRLTALKALGAMSGAEQEGAGGGYSGRHGIRIGNRWVAYAYHKPAAGKHFFDRAKVSTQQAGSREIRKQQAAAIGKAFQ